MQIDVKFLSFPGNVKLYQFTAVDEATRIRALKSATRRKTPSISSTTGALQLPSGTLREQTRSLSTVVLQDNEALVPSAQPHASQRTVNGTGRQVPVFVSLDAGVAWGQVTTWPMVFAGTKLSLNVDARRSSIPSRVITGCASRSPTR